MIHLLCGVAGSALPKEQLAATAGRMADGLGADVAAPVRRQTTDGAAMAVAGDSGDRLYADGGVLCALSGSPYWSDPGLDAVREQQGQAAALAEAYRRHGPALLDRLHGPFAVAVTDTTENTTLLAVDRMGVDSLYYAARPGSGLAFASTARSVQQHDDFRSAVDQQAIYEYLYFHMIPGPGTVFTGQHKVNPGEFVECRDEKIRTQRYWQPDFEHGAGMRERQLATELMELLRQSVTRCLSDEDVGCFLSGGIDSSTIAGLLSEIRPPAKTFTIGFDEHGYDETAFARTTAAHFGAEPLEYCVSPQEVVDVLPRIAQAYDEPFGNSSVVPTYYCARLARDNGVTTLLAGDGGDELFGGTARYVTQQIFGIYDRTPGWLRRWLIDPISLGLPGGDRFMPTRKLRSYVRQARVPMPDRLQTYNYFSRTPVADILDPEFLQEIDTDRPLELMRATYESSGATSMLNRMLELDWKFTLADNDLRKVNRMCQLAGVDVAYPFLDDDLVEFSTRIPPGLKIRRFKLRYFIKRALRDYLPDKVLTKSKHGFGLPFGIWMQSYGPLRDLAYDSLASLGKRRVVRVDYIDQLIDSHRNVHAHYYGEFIWVLMMLELWLSTHEGRAVTGRAA